MNSKIIGGFLAGILVAGGGVFLLMRDNAVPAVPVASAPLAAAAPALVAAPPVEVVAPVVETTAPVPVKQASGFKPAAAKEKVAVAVSKPSPAPVAAAITPAAAPVLESRPAAPSPCCP